MTKSRKKTIMGLITNLLILIMFATNLKANIQPYATIYGLCWEIHLIIISLEFLLIGRDD